MGYETDLARSKQIRKDAQTLKSPVSKAKALAAADRLEARAVKSLSRLGKRKRKGTGRSGAKAGR